MQQLSIESFVDLSAQASDVNVDDIIDRRRARGLFPNVAGKHFTRDYAALIPQEVLKQIVLARGEINGHPATGDRVSLPVEQKVRDAHPILFLGRTSPKQSS